MSRTQVQLWYKRLKEDREDVNDPSMLTTVENMETVKKMILDNRRITIVLERLLMVFTYFSAHGKQFLRMFRNC